MILSVVLSCLYLSDGFKLSMPTGRYKRANLNMEVFANNPVGKKIWEIVWKLPVMRPGEQGSPIKFGDSANILRRNIEQIYGNEPSIDGAPLATGEIDGLLTGSLFLGLKDYYHKVAVCR